MNRDDYEITSEAIRRAIDNGDDPLGEETNKAYRAILVQLIDAYTAQNPHFDWRRFYDLATGDHLDAPPPARPRR